MTNLPHCQAQLFKAITQNFFFFFFFFFSRTFLRLRR